MRKHESWKCDNSASGDFGKPWIKKMSASQMKTGETIKGTWGYFLAMLPL